MPQLFLHACHAAQKYYSKYHYKKRYGLGHTEHNKIIAETLVRFAHGIAGHCRALALPISRQAYRGTRECRPFVEYAEV